MQPPRFEFYDPHSPIYTSPRFLPPAKIVQCKVSDAIISHGAYLEECIVENAIIGLRSRVGKGVTIRVRSQTSPSAGTETCTWGRICTWGSTLSAACIQCCARVWQMS